MDGSKVWPEREGKVGVDTHSGKKKKQPLAHGSLLTLGVLKENNDTETH